MNIQEKLTKIVEDMPKVYEAGKTEGIAEGKKAEYDAFWDKYQNAINGSSNVYSAMYMFAGTSWNDTVFKPKYSMRYITRADNMFASANIGNLKGILERRGLVFDFKNSTNFRSMFAYSQITAIPEIDTMKATGTALNSMFAYATSLHTIDKLAINSNGTQTFSDTFRDCTALENIEISGIIASNGFNVQWSTKLTKASITSIINALSTTTTGLTVTFSKTAVNNAFATSEGAADGSTSAEWLALVATKSNWTISLA